MRSSQNQFKAVVLAADRENNNPVALQAGVSCKSMAPVAGVPMIFRVLKSLFASTSIEDTLLCGPPQQILDQEIQLTEYLESEKVSWVNSKSTPSLSTLTGLQFFSTDQAVLLTTSDHALLSPKIIDYFCQQANESGCDIVAGFARLETVMEAYPETSRTAYRFKDGSYCSCNLFAFLTPKSKDVPSFWRKVEQHRKNPLKVISILGWSTVLLYLLRRLTLSDVMERLSKRLHCHAGVVIIPYPEASIDVDTEQDLHFVNTLVANKTQRL